ncbi:uncharacterized protein LOC125039993 [Penaeus chinensis]|uniref:uncharacterized protein LOC125039993 n=1 Tax=Penaeus chinensis TaxID=139456 RepID=UPI001FB83950|nr:uncharacterized protein LOC125039993 [Penaeus chinensis]
MNSDMTTRISRRRSVCQRPPHWASCRLLGHPYVRALSQWNPAISSRTVPCPRSYKLPKARRQGTAAAAMAGWRRLIVAALLQLAFSRVLPTENCYEKGKLSKGSGYFNCSKPRLNFSDTPSILTMDFRNRNQNNVFSLSLNRTADAFHLITLKGRETINSTQIDLRDSSSKLQLNIDRSSVRAKTHGTWRKLDIPKTDEIFSLYFRGVPPNPALCITCYGEDIWQNGRDAYQSTEQGVVQSIQSTEQGVVETTQSTEQGVVETTEQSMTQSPGATEQSETGIMQWLSLLLAMIVFHVIFII